MQEKARRERLLRNLESTDKAHPLEFATTFLRKVTYRCVVGNEASVCRKTDDNKLWGAADRLTGGIAIAA